MNLTDSGESSSKRQENGDVTTEVERPLKKARFAWQVKGKYHLKNDFLDEDSNKTSSGQLQKRNSSPDYVNDPQNIIGNAEQNLEILGDYLLKQDFNTLDSVIADNNHSLLVPFNEGGKENSSYSTYICSYDNNGMNVPSNACDSSISEESSIPMSMVHQSMSVSEDQCIARWQARQMAKGFVDNTINRVLDSWMVAPIPSNVEHNNNHVLAMDVANFVNNMPENNSIENEGILMAISAHGLHNTAHIKPDSLQKIEESNTMPSNFNENVFPSPPSSPQSSDDETLSDPNTDKFECMCSNNIPSSTRGVYKEQNSQLFSYTPEESINSTPQHFVVPNIETVGIDSFYEENNFRINCDELFTNHFDFMDTAVSFAIQSKGLTSHSSRDFNM